MPITPEKNGQDVLSNQYTNEVGTNNESHTTETIDDNIVNDNSTSIGQSKIKGLSNEEMNDPNKIRVTVADKDAPLIILFGPPACGKTMTLVRLTRFLQSEGYIVSPIHSFRPSTDTNYKEICENFNEMINSDNAAASTDRITFMLIEVIKNGKRLCQILEAPGEYYFDPKEPKKPFPNYVNTIIASTNRKVWTIMVEPDWMDHSDRSNYVTKISDLKKQMGPSDNVIFLFNKIDRTNFVRRIGDINVKAAINDTKNLYPNIFVPFMNENPITRFFNEYNCEFIPFQTGTYTTAMDNTVTYQEGPVVYCRKLWNLLSSKI